MNVDAFVALKVTMTHFNKGGNDPFLINIIIVLNELTVNSYFLLYINFPFASHQWGGQIKRGTQANKVVRILSVYL